MRHWAKLATLSDHELGKLDIAETHLLCAVGLPSSVELDIPECLAKLDYYASCIAELTERLRPRYEANRQQFTYCPEFFRMICLIMYLEDVHGVHSNLKLNETRDARDSSDIFFHGLLAGKGGTCSSIPLLYVALGRRLGYPLFLVAGANHQFARWDDGRGMRFNMECTPRGLNTPPDDYYRTWPRPVSQREVDDYCYLETMTPTQELAGFLSQRGHALIQHKRHEEGIDAIVAARLLHPRNKMHVDSSLNFLRDWQQHVFKIIPMRFPEITVNYPNKRCYPGIIPLSFEQEVLRLKSMEMIISDKEHEERWWQHLRKPLRHWPSQIPTGMTITSYKKQLLTEGR